jgi:hypothetical protein
MESFELIKKFGEKIGVNLTPDEDNVYTFEVDEMIVTFHVLPELEEIVLSGDIGEPPPEHLENLYKTMLESQYLFNGTAGATISLNSENNRFSLCKALPCRILDVDLFYAETENFINTLEVWIKLVKDYRDVAPKAEDVKTVMPEIGSNGFIRA